VAHRSPCRSCSWRRSQTSCAPCWASTGRLRPAGSQRTAGRRGRAGWRPRAAGGRTAARCCRGACLPATGRGAARRRRPRRARTLAQTRRVRTPCVWCPRAARRVNASRRRAARGRAGAGPPGAVDRESSGMTRLTCQPVARSAHCSRLTQRRAASTGDVESGFTSCFSGHPHALMCWDELNAEHQCTSATPAPLDVWGHYRLQAGYCGPARRSGAQDGPPSQGPLRLPLPDASACTCSYRMCIRKWLHFQRRLQGGQAVGRGRLATARSSAPPCSRRLH